MQGRQAGTATTIMQRFIKGSKDHNLSPVPVVIGMSATPERTNKRNMAYEKFGDDVVYEMSLTEALSGEKKEKFY